MNQENLWDHFQNNFESGDAFGNAIPRYEFIAKSVESGQAVLNIGVGSGGIESILIGKRAIVHCLDPNEDAVARIRKNHQLGDQAKVGFSQKIPFQDNKFDVVIMTEVLEHLTEDVLMTTLLEVKRVLKPKGFFIGTVPANEKLSDNQIFCPHCGVLSHRWGHVQSFSIERLSEIFITNKFHVERLENRSFPSWRRRGVGNFIKSLVRYALGRVGSPIASPNIFFKVRSRDFK